MKQRQLQLLLGIAIASISWSLAATHHAERIRSIRSESRLRCGSSPYEINPNYVRSSSNQNARPAMLGELERQEYGPPTDPFRCETQQPRKTSVSLLEQIATYCTSLHVLSPTLSSGSLFCILIFVLWQMPRFHGVLQKYFVCSRRSIREGRYTSVFLSAFSHASPGHFLVDMFAFLSFGPSLRQTLATSNWPLWPLVVGAALFASLFFLLFGSQGGCMGLSGVTLSFLALQARLTPQREFGVALFGVLPVRMPAQIALTALLIWSLIGSLYQKSQVAHAAHMGGLLFGMGYYELWLRRGVLRRMSYKVQNVLANVFRR